MNWYLSVLKKYAVFSGRARRKEYWLFFFFNLIFMIAAAVLDNVLKTTIRDMAYGWIYLLYSVAILIPDTAVIVRRLHDVGKSGWWYLIILVPLVGFIWLLVFLMTASRGAINMD